MTIVQEEVFGPVLTMQVFDTGAEAVRLADDSSMVGRPRGHAMSWREK